MGFELGRAKRNGKGQKGEQKEKTSLNHLQTRYLISKCYLIYLWKHKLGTNYGPLYLLLQGVIAKTVKFTNENGLSIGAGLMLVGLVRHLKYFPCQ